MNPPALVIVEVSGGVVQAVYCDCNVKVIIADWDNAEVGDDLCHESMPIPLAIADEKILESAPVQEALKA